MLTFYLLKSKKIDILLEKRTKIYYQHWLNFCQPFDKLSNCLSTICEFKSLLISAPTAVRSVTSDLGNSLLKVTCEKDDFDIDIDISF